VENKHAGKVLYLFSHSACMHAVLIHMHQLSKYKFWFVLFSTSVNVSIHPWVYIYIVQCCLFDIPGFELLSMLST